MKSNIIALACAAVFGLAASTQAATVVWGPATTISGDSDVSTTGILDRAYTFGTGFTTTVNGVTFTPFANAGDTDTFGQSYPSYGGAVAAPFSSLSTAYQNLLTGGLYGNNPNTSTLTLGNLTLGTAYQLQVWVNDSRSNAGPGRFENLDGTSPNLDYNSTDAEGGVGQFTIGTFIADATSQTITFNASSGGNQFGPSPQINGLELSSAPEPGTFGLLGLGLAGLVARRRRI